MVIAFSPKHTSSDFPNGPTNIDEKIDFFLARVEGWQLGPAKEMIDKDVSHRAFAMLSICLSYFEMIAIYRDGFIGKNKSAKYFKKGMVEVFPELGLPENEEVLSPLYENARCSLYHAGMTSSNVLLTGDIPKSLGYHSAKNMLIINPNILVEDLFIHFARYSEELRNPVNNGFRKNFELRYDHDNN